MLNSPAAQADNEKLAFTMGGASGEGYVTTEGFVLLAGAKLNEKVSEKSMAKGFLELRNKLLAAGKIKDLVTTEDILFSSSSAAGAVLAGYNVSGPMNWKNASGKSLKEIEAEKMNDK